MSRDVPRHMMLALTARRAMRSGARSLSFSMVRPPVAACVPPGECQFGDEWTAAPLLSKEPLSHDTRLFSFGLPDGARPLGLSTCACLLAGVGTDCTADATPIIRPYTPVSTNELDGRFELMVKVYNDADGGGLSAHLDRMAVGDTSVSFRHIPFNVKRQCVRARRSSRSLPPPFSRAPPPPSTRPIPPPPPPPPSFGPPAPPAPPPPEFVKTLYYNAYNSQTLALQHKDKWGTGFEQLNNINLSRLKHYFSTQFQHKRHA